MRKYYWILLFAVGLFSCTKVSKLSDTAEIVSFTILDQTEGIILNKDEITITNNVVTIPLDYGRKLFPLTIKADIKFSSTTDDVISVDEEPLNLKEITFKDVYTPQTFYLISESGIPLLGKIILKDKTNAEITNFHVTNYTEEEVSVAIRNNNIRINFKQDFNWPVTVEADITHNGKIKAGSAQSPFTFSGPKDQKQITLIADDNQDERVWNIQVVPTIENSNFESWINVDNSKVNIDPTPGKGLGWATANNSFVQGTTPVPYQKGYAAQLQTGIQNLTNLGIGELITAGTIFTGYFQIKISALNNPPLMTYFGIPFIMRPQSISFDAKYVAGAKFKQSERKLPVEFPYTDHLSLTVNLTIPEGYVVDEKPEGLRVQTGDGKVFCRYTITQQNNQVTLRYLFRLQKLLFLNTDYPELQQLWEIIAKKNNEMMVCTPKQTYMLMLTPSYRMP